MRAGGSDVSQAGICSWVITAQLGVRPSDGSLGDERRVDLQHVVALGAAEPALDPLGVAGDPLERVLHVDPAAARALELPAPAGAPDVA